MPYKIQFFVAGDDLSKKMLRVVDRVTRLLAERFGPRITSSSRDFIAYVLVTNIVSLNLEHGVADVIQLDVYFILEIYREELKARFGVADFPAAILDNQVHTGKRALEIASKLHDLLEKYPSIGDNEIMARLRALSTQEPIVESKTSIEKPSRSTFSIPQKMRESVVEAASRVVPSITRIAQPPAPPSPSNTGAGIPTVSVQPKPEPASKGLQTDKVIFEHNVIRAGILDCLAKLERLREEGKIDENTYRKMKETYDALLS